jgi:hypothetical protein
MGNDLILDLFVGRLRNNLFVDQIELCAIGASCNNFLCVSVADARQGFELLGGSSVNVEFVGRGKPAAMQRQSSSSRGQPEAWRMRRAESIFAARDFLQLISYFASSHQHQRLNPPLPKPTTSYA